ncbi:uncharacterized protein LY89DRAFT_124254 [Mollisia scopiformis]|uniref:Uncharacterized protein n=1 Tax=Mollisia scopiformis TaxID=149040 RepID=A0A194X493_MOLSC|nr:uncharacterized protein LY89DRAFT_124254 [Mollisia scopiformis]KUJ14879.1 hypothetical protein LY89DRAFT_124254 [Mollisia scopiformis]
MSSGVVNIGRDVRAERVVERPRTVSELGNLARTMLTPTEVPYSVGFEQFENCQVVTLDISDSSATKCLKRNILNSSQKEFKSLLLGTRSAQRKKRQSRRCMPMVNVSRGPGVESNVLKYLVGMQRKPITRPVPSLRLAHLQSSLRSCSGPQEKSITLGQFTVEILRR